MLKNILGDWGSTLGDGDYACALAALGVLESTGTLQHQASSDPEAIAHMLEEEFKSGERTPVWRGAHGSLSSVDSWHETIHTDAAALAAGWRRYRATINHDRQVPRLAVAFEWSRRDDLFNFDDLYLWLKSPDAAINAVVLEDRTPRHSVNWHWPLRVGVRAGHDELLKPLRAAQARHGWSRRLSSCFIVGDARDACDVLILTRAALQQLLAEKRTRLRANFCVCLADPVIDFSSVTDRYTTLCVRLHAAGLAVVGNLNDAALEDWFIGTLAHLSHDVPIHGAVCRAWRPPGSQDPLVIGNPDALDRCRILSIAEQQDRIAAAIETQRRLPQDPVFGGPAAPPRPRIRFADEVRSRAFTSESVDGERTANWIEQMQNDIDKTRTPRWIQANAWRGDAPLAAAPSLAPGRWNVLGVHIGPTEKARADASFPDSQVNFNQGDVFITVQLELAGASVTAIKDEELRSVPRQIRLIDMPMVAAGLEQALQHRLTHNTDLERDKSDDTATIVGLASADVLLPPAGDSGLALFGVNPQDQTQKIDGRIAIIHGNRVLQTATLSASVDQSADAGDGLTVTAKSIHDSDNDLDERREYDVAIEVSDIGGKLHLKVQRGKTVTPVQLQDLAKSIAAMGKALDGVARQSEYSKPILDQPMFPDTLFTLAAQGSALYQHLRKMCGPDIDLWDRIHLVPFTNEFLPLEYVYDGPPPTMNPTVCRNMLGALEQGGCDQAVELPGGAFGRCPNQNDKAFVCPMHFWGFRKLIERNGTLPARADSRAASDSPVCVPSRQPYGKVSAMLFAASNRAFTYVATPQQQADERAKLIKSLDTSFGTPSDASPDWEQWRTLVKKKPNLLVLVAHTDEIHGVPALEIGDHQLLGRHEIGSDVSGAAGQPQLLILLGCSAAEVTEDFQPYPERFRDAGVSIVVAPVATIRGADAVPIAKAIAEMLSARLSRPEPTAFGDLLPLLRRQLLREGHAGVMGIVGFGDGDWLIGGQ